MVAEACRCKAQGDMEVFSEALKKGWDKAKGRSERRMAGQDGMQATRR